MRQYNHTPGPWKVVGPIAASVPRGYSNDEIAINYGGAKNSNGFEVARAVDIWNDVERDANANLIAAAPELFNALVEVMDFVESINPQGMNVRGADYQIYNICKGAVNKVTENAILSTSKTPEA